MARATTLFVATDEDLVRLFVAVRRSLEEPITSVRKNPVIHQVVATANWDPGEDDEAAVISSRHPTATPPVSSSIYAEAKGNEGGPIAPVIRPSSRPAVALEETAPLRLRALPHAAVVGITGLEIEALTMVLLGESKPPARIVEPLDEDGFVDSLPAEVLPPLAALADDAIGPLLDRWNGALKVTRRHAEPIALFALRELAKEAIVRGGNVFTHMPVSPA